MKKTTIYEDGDYFLSVEVAQPLVRVLVDFADPTIGWVYAKGNAKCNPEDTFDENFGANLATSRAMHRLYKKVEKRLVKYAG